MSRTLELAWDGQKRVLNYWEDLNSHLSVALDLEGIPPINVGASVHSLTGRLGLTAESLAERLPWTAAKAAAFILTGQVSAVPPITMEWQDGVGRGYERAVVTLQVEPWVPHAVVTRAYRQAQQELLAGPNRAVRERSAELVRFLAEEGWRLSVRDSMRSWNELHPEWREDDPRAFQTAGERAKALVLMPRWGAEVVRRRTTPPPWLRALTEMEPSGE